MFWARVLPLSFLVMRFRSILFITVEPLFFFYLAYLPVSPIASSFRWSKRTDGQRRQRKIPVSPNKANQGHESSLISEWAVVRIRLQKRIYSLADEQLNQRMLIGKIWLIIILSSANPPTLVQASEDENRLIHYLFSEQGYNPLVRPTAHSNETVVVSFGLLLVQLIHVSLRDDQSKIVGKSFLLRRFMRRNRSWKQIPGCTWNGKWRDDCGEQWFSRRILCLGTIHNCDGILIDMVLSMDTPTSHYSFLVF